MFSKYSASSKRTPVFPLFDIIFVNHIKRNYSRLNHFSFRADRFDSSWIHTLCILMMHLSRASGRAIHSSNQLQCVFALFLKYNIDTGIPSESQLGLVCSLMCVIMVFLCTNHKTQMAGNYAHYTTLIWTMAENLSFWIII